MNLEKTSILLLIVSLFTFVSGCGQQLQTSTTTTGTVATSQLNAAKMGAMVANGSSSTATAAGAVGSSAGSTPKASSIGRLSAPPSTFFTVDMTSGTASVDGYICPVSSALLGGNVTPYIKLNTVGGSVINGAYLAGKKIANLDPVSVEAIMGTGPGSIPTGMSSGIGGFVTKYMTALGLGQNPYASNAFTQIKYMGDYLAWAFVFPTMEASAQAAPGWPAGVKMTTPEALAADKIASMDEKMVFSTTATGEMNVTVNTQPDGRPTAGTYTGTGKIYTALAVIDASVTMVFPTTGDPPSTITTVGTTESAPIYTVTVTFSPATGTGTGTIKDSSGTQIGTITTNSNGGSVTIGSTTEAFTF